MITPDNQIPLDDQDNSENDDQQSQQDIHNNGLDDTPEDGDIVDYANPDKLKQAYEAAESAFTLNLGEDGDDKTDDDE
jgi:hypothetical protein